VRRGGASGRNVAHARGTALKLREANRLQKQGRRAANAIRSGQIPVWLPVHEAGHVIARIQLTHHELTFPEISALLDLQNGQCIYDESSRPDIRRGLLRDVQ
jgi:hypothetical protein